jgi:hypothetical protein
LASAEQSKEEEEIILQRLEKEDKEVTIQSKQLDIAKKRLTYAHDLITYAHTLSTKFIATLEPGADAATRATLVREYLPDFLQLGTKETSDIVLSRLKTIGASQASRETMQSPGQSPAHIVKPAPSSGNELLFLPVDLVVPDLLNLNYSHAIDRASNAGMKVVVEGEETRSDVEPGTVVSQYPGPESRIAHQIQDMNDNGVKISVVLSKQKSPEISPLSANDQGSDNNTLPPAETLQPTHSEPRREKPGKKQQGAHKKKPGKPQKKGRNKGKKGKELSHSEVPESAPPEPQEEKPAEVSVDEAPDPSAQPLVTSLDEEEQDPYEEDYKFAQQLREAAQATPSSESSQLVNIEEIPVPSVNTEKIPASPSLSENEIIYVDAGDDLAKIQERIEETHARHIILLVPPKTHLRNDVSWRLLDTRAREPGKDVRVISMSRQTRAVAEAAGFKILDLPESPGSSNSIKLVTMERSPDALPLSIE